MSRKILLFFTALLIANACANFSKSKYFNENRNKWTYEAASAQCRDEMTQAERNTSFNNICGGHGSDLGYTDVMIVRWFCLKECEKIANGELITLVQCGAAGSSDIIPGAYGSPKQVRMRCGCNFGDAKTSVANDISTMLTKTTRAYRLVPQSATPWTEIEKEWEEECLESNSEENEGKFEDNEASKDENNKSNSEKSTEEEDKQRKTDEKSMENEGENNEQMSEKNDNKEKEDKSKVENYEENANKSAEEGENSTK